MKWFPPSWVQIKTESNILYIDPAYLRTYFIRYPKKIEFSRWPNQIDGLPEELEKAGLILVTHAHKDHCKRVTINRLRRPNTLVVGPHACMKELGSEMNLVSPGEVITFGDMKRKIVEAKIHQRGLQRERPIV